MSTHSEVSRRGFLRTSAVGAAGVAAAQVIPASALGKDGHVPPSERINVGLIGCGGMGRANLRNCAVETDVVVAAACDVWKTRLDAVIAKHKATAKPHHDYRELLARKDIDGVIIATPPHWHCLHGGRRGRGGQGHLSTEADDPLPGREPGRAERGEEAQSH